MTFSHFYHKSTKDQFIHDSEIDHIILQIKICCFFFALKSRDKFFKGTGQQNINKRGPVETDGFAAHIVINTRIWLSSWILTMYR